MWLRAATCAGCVGLASFPVLHECTSKNLICGATSYDKYMRSADIDKQVLYVLEYLVEEAGDLLLDVAIFLRNSGYIVVVVDLAKYIGSTLFCVAIDQAFRHLQGPLRIFEWREHDVIVSSPKYPSALDVVASAILGETDAEDSSESESCLKIKPTWRQHSKKSSAQGETIQESESVLVQTQDEHQSVLTATQAVEDSGLRIPFVKGNVSEKNDSIFDRNGSSNKDTLQRTETGSDISLSGHLPSSEESNQDQHTFKAVVKKAAVSLNPYDADISDQEVALSTWDQQSHSKIFLSGHGTTNQRVLSDVSAVTGPRNSLQNSNDTPSIRTDSFEQLHRRTQEAPSSVTYSSLRKLHSRRNITRSELDPDSEVYTTSSEEQATNSTTSSGEQATNALSENGSSRATAVSDNDVFDASSYILSSRSLSSDRVTEGIESQETKINVSQEQSELIQEAMMSAADDTASLEPGEQKVRFCQLPLYHTSATALISCPNSEFRATPVMAADARNTDTTLSNDEAHSCRSISGYPDAGLSNDPSTNQGGTGMTRHIDENLERVSVCTHSQPGAQHSLYYPLDSDDVTWRVFFVQVLCCIIIGRHWRKLF